MNFASMSNKILMNSKHEESSTPLSQVIDQGFTCDSLLRALRDRTHKGHHVHAQVPKPSATIHEGYSNGFKSVH